MRTYPETESDLEELKDLNAEDWMIQLLKMNPEYVFWGPHEDYMLGGSGWSSPQFYATWSTFDWGLDELNECANFYFEVSRSAKDCKYCDSTGLNPETLRLSKTWYDFEGTGNRWCDKLTQHEVDALLAQGRLFQFKNTPTVEEVNRDRNVHDAINQWICVRARAEREGVYGVCKYCQGAGYTYTEPSAHVRLILWMLHPRKGCSRGVEIKRVQQEDLPAIFEYLATAAQRNADRFAKVLSSHIGNSVTI